MGKKINIKMKQGREKLPESQKKQQVWMYAKTEDIEAIGGHEAAQELLKQLFAAAVKNAKNANS